MEKITSLNQLQRLTKLTMNPHVDISRQILNTIQKNELIQRQKNEELGVADKAPFASDDVEGFTTPAQKQSTGIDALIDLEETILDAINQAQDRKSDTNAVNIVHQYGNAMQELVKRISRNRGNIDELVGNLRAFFNEAIKGAEYKDTSTGETVVMDNLKNNLVDLRKVIQHSLRLKSTGSNDRTDLIEKITGKAEELLQEAKASRQTIVEQLGMIKDQLEQLPVQSLQTIEQTADSNIDGATFFDFILREGSKRSRASRRSRSRVVVEEDAEADPTDASFYTAQDDTTPLQIQATPQPRQLPGFDPDNPFIDAEDQSPPAKAPGVAGPASAGPDPAEPEPDAPEPDKEADVEDAPPGPVEEGDVAHEPPHPVFGYLTDDQQQNLLLNNLKFYGIPGELTNHYEKPVKDLIATPHFANKMYGKTLLASRGLVKLVYEFIEMDPAETTQKKIDIAIVEILATINEVIRKYNKSPKNTGLNTKQEIVYNTNFSISQLLGHLGYDLDPVLQEAVDNSLGRHQKAPEKPLPYAAAEGAGIGGGSNNQNPKRVSGIAFLRSKWTAWMAQDMVYEFLQTGKINYFPTAMVTEPNYYLYLYGTTQRINVPTNAFAQNGIAVV